jgi:DNA-binding MarR family transcriptional regulator
VIAKPDPLIHPITRLSICGLLAAGADWVEFAALRDAAGISDSVLSKQSRVLEDAGYVKVRKGAVGRRPRTWFRLTAEGRRVLEGHLAWLVHWEEAVPPAPGMCSRRCADHWIRRCSTARMNRNGGCG